MCSPHITAFTFTDTSHNYWLIHVTFPIIHPSYIESITHSFNTISTFNIHLTCDSLFHPFIYSYPHKHQPTRTIRTIIYWHRSDIIWISIPYQLRYQQPINIIIIPIRRPLIHTTHRATVYILNHNPYLSYPLLYKPISTFDYRCVGSGNGFLLSEGKPYVLKMVISPL